MDAPIVGSGRDNVALPDTRSVDGVDTSLIFSPAASHD